MKEESIFTKEKTLELLSKLDDWLEKDGYQRKFGLYCMGGTKMVLSDMRYSSKDVDFMLSREDFRVFSSYIAELWWKEKIRFDAFPEGEFVGYSFDDFKQRAKRAPFMYKHIDLYFVDNIDFIITKALAGRERDVEDIKILLKKDRFSKEAIVKRFGELKIKPEKEKELREKFKEFLDKFYS